MLLPDEKRRLLDDVIEALREVPGLVAIVLGGSYARGYARPDSDLDVGLYYREAAPLPVDRVRAIAERISLPGSPPVVTEPYAWGAWVNGGAWVQTTAGRVDFLYKNLDQIERVIEEGHRGIWRHDFDQQAPYGFRSVVYFGETHFCVALHDPEGAIARLKSSVAEYPERLRRRIVQECLWGAEFSLFVAGTFAAAGDVYNTAGCLTRVAQALVHALFALNSEYFLSDKCANRLLDGFALRPTDFTARLAAVLAHPGEDAAELRRSLERIGALWLETVRVTGGAYQPRFDLAVSLA